MARVKQSKRVSWAPAMELCQVRLFLSEDAPSQSGLGVQQDQLQAKTSWLWHSRAAQHLPPGFEPPPPSPNRSKVAQIPLIQWKPPLKFSVRKEWLVVAGEESKEVEIQNHRQQGVFEAIYPRPSSIPPNPVSSETVDIHYGDPPPFIPVTAIEDDSAEELDLPNWEKGLEEIDPSEAVESPVSREEKTLFNLPEGMGPAASAAASAAFTALLKSSEEGSLIDQDLLIRILSNPSMIEKLLSEHETPGSQHPMTTSTHVDLPAAAATATATNNPPPARDASYFKTLIQQHGGDGYGKIGPGYGPLERNQGYYGYKGLGGSNAAVEQGNVKGKVSKLCAFFNSARGCRNGMHCPFIHDTSMPSRNNEQQQAWKKIKLDNDVVRRA